MTSQKRLFRSAAVPPAANGRLLAGSTLHQRRRLLFVDQFYEPAMSRQDAGAAGGMRCLL